MSTNKSVIKSAGIIGIATLCSRILGFLRDVVIARIFGVYVYAQAFVIALRLPNLFRDILAEGAANSCIVPVLSEEKAKANASEFWELVNILFNLLVIVSCGIVLLGVILAPILVRIIAPGFVADTQKFLTTVTLTRLIFPYLLLISLASLATSVLNTLKHFTIPALAPCILNISLIVFAFFFGEGIKGLTLGVLVGGVLQFLVQLPILYKKGFFFRITNRFHHPAVVKIVRLLLPRLVSSSLYQINNFVDSIFASLAFVVGEGAVAILYFAYRIIQFPLGIFSTALTQAALPTFSQQALEDSLDSLKHTLLFSLKAMMLVLLPATIGCLVLSKFIIANLFGGGRFDSYSVDRTAQVLFFYSLGLVAYGGSKILQSCFFALKDTATPAKVLALNVVLNVIFNSLLMFPLQVNGLALATSISGFICFGVLLFLLYQRLDGFDLKRLSGSLIRILAASLAMGLVAFITQRFFIFGDSGFFRFLSVCIVLSFSGCSYLLFCLLFKVEQINLLWQWVARKI